MTVQHHALMLSCKYLWLEEVGIWNFKYYYMPLLVGTRNCKKKKKKNLTNCTAAEPIADLVWKECWFYKKKKNAHVLTLQLFHCSFRTLQGMLFTEESGFPNNAMLGCLGSQGSQRFSCMLGFRWGDLIRVWLWPAGSNLSLLWCLLHLYSGLLESLI